MAKDLANKVYQQLKADIINDTFPIDGIITEQMLADRYGVSKTPAREAAIRLVYEDYLVKYPSKGYTVRNPGEQEINNIIDYRYLLECGIAERIIAKASDEEIKNLLFLDKPGKNDDASVDEFSRLNLEFHMAMAELTHNESIVSCLRGALYLLLRPSIITKMQQYASYTGNSPAYAHTVSEEGCVMEHINIVYALLDRDLEKVRACLAEDIFPVHERKKPV